jgi:hypothetical protein
MRHIFYILFFIFFIADKVHGGNKYEQEKLEGVIYNFVKTAPRRHLARNKKDRIELAAEIIEAANRYNLDPYLVFQTAIAESGLYTDIEGPGGEIGIMQLHGAALTTCKHDMDTRQGQLLCGARWLRINLDRCGSITGAITGYISGSCFARTETTQGKVNFRVAEIERIKNE